GDHRAGAVPDGDQPLVLQRAVGGGDGVQVDPEVGRHLADGGKGVAFGQLAPGDQGLDLVRHLLVDRTAVAGIHGDPHVVVLPVYGDNIHHTLLLSRGPRRRVPL